MLQCELMLAHLGKNSADVQVNVAWVRDLKALVYCLFAKVQIVVLDFKGLLKIGKCAAKLFGAAEHAGKVIVCNGTVSIAFFCKTHCLVKQFQ